MIENRPVLTGLGFQNGNEVRDRFMAVFFFGESEEIEAGDFFCERIEIDDVTGKAARDVFQDSADARAMRIKKENAAPCADVLNGHVFEERRFSCA